MFILTNKVELTQFNDILHSNQTIFFHEKWPAQSFIDTVVFAYLEPIQKPYMVIDLFFRR